MTTALENWQKWILENRFLTLFTTIVLCFALGYGGQYLQFSTDYRVFFGKDNPQLKAFEETQNVFNKDDNVMLVVEPKSGSVFEPEFLKIIKDLSKEAKQTPYQTRVDSLTNFQHVRSIDDDLIISDLVESPLRLSKEQLLEIEQVALNEPNLVHRLVDPKSKITAINITLELPSVDPEASAEVQKEQTTKVLNATPKVAKSIRELRDEYLKKYPDINIYLSGLAMLNNAFGEASKVDMMKLTPIMFIVILGLLLVLTWSLSGTIATIGVILLSTIGAYGIAGFIGIKLTPTSITAATVIMTLAVADCVHIVLSILQNRRKGLEKVQAIKSAIVINVLPVFITSLTTAIGFLSLNFSDAPPYHDYGNITAIGVSIACFLSLTFLPAMMALFPLNVKVVESRSLFGFDVLGQWVIGKRKVLLLMMPVAIILLGIGAHRLTLNDQFVNYFGPEIEFRRDTDAVMDKLTGIYNMSFPLKTKLDSKISDPKYLKKVEEFVEYLRSEEDVVHVNSITDTFKRLNKNLNGDQSEFYKIPENTRLSAQYLWLYSNSLPKGFDLENTINNDETSTKLVATLTNTTTVRLRALEDRANAWIQEHAQDVFEGAATSPAVMFSHISKRNINSMMTGTALSMVLVTIIMIIAMRSFKYGLLSLIPNMVPVIMTFGLWGYIEGMVDMGVATIAGLTLGIVVDDTVHFMIKYLRARREEQSSSEDSIRSAFERVGPALAMTSIVLVSGFGVMTLSSFRMNWTMGVMSAATIGFALIVDLLLLPAILMAMDARRQKKQESLTQASVA